MYRHFVGGGLANQPSWLKRAAANKRFHLTAYRSVFGDCAPAKALVGGVSLAVPAASETQALGGSSQE